MSRYTTEEPFHIPKEIEFTDAISLDVELQLIREEFQEEMAPIDAAWAAYKPRRTWGQLLPMARYEPPDYEWVHITALQLQFVKHLVWTGEISMLEADGLITRPGFRTAFERLKELYGGLSMECILDSANLMWELQQECEKAVA